MNEIALSENLTISIDPEDYRGYTVKEIYKLWRGAKNQEYEIKILSQLCDCSKKRIISILSFVRQDSDPPLPTGGTNCAKNIHPECSGLSETAKCGIIEDFRRGIGIESIALKRCISYSSVYKVLRESGTLKGRCSRTKK